MTQETERVKKIFEGWAKTYDTTVENLNAKLIEVVKRQKERNPSLSGWALIRPSLADMFSDLENIRISGGNLKAVIAGNRGVTSWLDINRRTREFLYRNSPDEAISRGVVNDGGDAVDTREKIWENGKEVPNPFYKAPIKNLPKSEFLRNTEIRVPVIIDDTIKHVVVKGEKTVDIEVPIGREVEFDAAKSKADDSLLYLNSERFTPTDTVVDLEKELDKVGVKSMDEVEKVNEKYVLFEASVFDMSFTTQSNRIILGDVATTSPYQILGYAPPELKPDFGNESRVIVGGFKRLIKGDDGTVRHRVTIDILVPRKGEMFPVEKTPQVTSDNIPKTTTPRQEETGPTAQTDGERQLAELLNI